MAKVAMMESGLRRKQTYEEIIDYIENDPDKVQYPNRAAKFLRNTFQLSQLDGMGQALLEQQEMNEMAERVKYYQLKALADQNETSKIIEDAKNKAHNLLQNSQQVAVVVAQVALFQELEVLLVVLQVGLEVWLEVR